MLEREVSDVLLPKYRFAYYRRRHDAPLAEHIGIERATGYKL
jgi:hypothetical protein